MTEIPRDTYDPELTDKFRAQEMSRVYRACDELAVGGSANIDPTLGEFLQDLGLVTELGMMHDERSWQVTKSFRPFYEHLRTTRPYQAAKR